MADQRAIIQHNAPFVVRIPDRRGHVLDVPDEHLLLGAVRLDKAVKELTEVLMFDERIIVRLKDVRDPVVVAQDGHHVHRLVGDVLVGLGLWRHDDVPVHRLLPDHPLQEILALANAQEKIHPMERVALAPGRPHRRPPLEVCAGRQHAHGDDGVAWGVSVPSERNLYRAVREEDGEQEDGGGDERAGAGCRGRTRCSFPAGHPGFWAIHRRFASQMLLQ